MGFRLPGVQATAPLALRAPPTTRQSLLLRFSRGILSELSETSYKQSVGARVRRGGRSCYSSFSEKRSYQSAGLQNMGLKSAYEDLRKRTLDKVEGTWGKLSYIAERRSENGAYRHWGFERAHGTEAAQQTFARAHQSLVGTVLRTRIRSLQEDLEQASSADGSTPVSYASKLTVHLRRLLPSGSPKMTELHLFSVLKTLSLLESRQQPDSRVSSQRLRLGRSPRPPADV